MLVSCPFFITGILVVLFGVTAWFIFLTLLQQCYYVTYDIWHVWKCEFYFNNKYVHYGLVNFSNSNEVSFMQRHIYGQTGKNINIFVENSSLAVNPSHIRSWLNLLSTTPRVAPFMSRNDPFITALEKVGTKNFHVCWLFDGLFVSLSWGYKCACDSCPWCPIPTISGGILSYLPKMCPRPVLVRNKQKLQVFKLVGHVYW